MPYYFNPPPMNPLSRLLAAVLAVLALVGAFFFGLFVLAFAAGLGVVMWLFLTLRMAWLRRKGLSGGAQPATGNGQEQRRGAGPAGKSGDIIDAEYTVVSRQDEDS